MLSTSPDFSLESHHAGIICGVDEAGRGPLAGPVVAAAVILNRHMPLPGVNDSKKLTAKKREQLCADIQKNHLWALGVASVEEIDQINILQATKLAMCRAVANLSTPPDIALVDGNQPPGLTCKTVCIVKGDSRSLSIAAASIIAKVTRDRMMQELGLHYPDYGFEKHAGYGTKMHLAALQQFGACAIHRRSFQPVAACMQSLSA